MKRLCLGLILLAAPGVWADEKPARQEAAGSTQQEEAKEVPLHEHPTLVNMLHQNNEIRRRLGLRPHRMSAKLTQAAQDHANYMARTGDFSHYTNFGYIGRARRFGYRGFVRENIAMGMGSVPATFAVWQGSPGHYASIVSGTTDAGFGYQVGRNGAPYWVAVYGSGDPDEAEAAKAEAEKAAAVAEEKKDETKQEATKKDEKPAE